MNQFDTGFEVGRLWMAWQIRHDFCGFSFELGKSYEVDSLMLGIQIGFGYLIIGFDLKGESK